jgi:hypothetical protein
MKQTKIHKSDMHDKVFERTAKENVKKFDIWLGLRTFTTIR